MTTMISLQTRYGHVAVDARAIKEFQMDLDNDMVVIIVDGPVLTRIPVIVTFAAVAELHQMLKDRGEAATHGMTFTITAEGLETPNG